MTPAEYKALREKLGLTQAELAARLGVTRKTVNSRERSPKRISAEAAMAIRSLNAKTEGPLGQTSNNESDV